MHPNPEAIVKAFVEILNGRTDQARKIVSEEYPFVTYTNAGRQYSYYQKTKVFIRDGFIDRYSGEKLIFPPVLRILSQKIPIEFPFHKNWKTSECHLAYWQLLPTIDHLIPIARGGFDQESNWVSTSQLRNSIKSNWLLEEVGWKLCAPGSIHEWDGMMKRYIEYANNNPSCLEDSYLNSWYKAAIRASET